MYTGQPPFYTNSIYSLINHIVKDPVKFPPDMPKDMKSFLTGLLQKNPAKRLNWPHLLDHPFVKESEDDRRLMRVERSLQSVCGGQRGPRARLAYMMGEQSEKLFGTQAIRGGAILGEAHGSDALPHAKKMRGRKQRLEAEREQYRHRAVLLREEYEREQRASSAPATQTSLLGGVDEQSPPNSPASRASSQQRASTAPSPQVEKCRSDLFSLPLSGVNLNFSADKISNALGQLASKTSGQSEKSPRIDAWASQPTATKSESLKLSNSGAIGTEGVLEGHHCIMSSSRESSVVDDIGRFSETKLRASRTESSTGALEVIQL